MNEEKVREMSGVDDKMPRYTPVQQWRELKEQRDKLREVLKFCYEQAHGTIVLGTREHLVSADYEEALEKIRDKLETLDDDDLGR